MSRCCLDTFTYSRLEAGNTRIAASAARAAATVLTWDTHFRHIGRVGSIVVEPGS